MSDRKVTSERSPLFPLSWIICLPDLLPYQPSHAFRSSSSGFLTAPPSKLHCFSDRDFSRTAPHHHQYPLPSDFHNTPLSPSLQIFPSNHIILPSFLDHSTLSFLHCHPSMPTLLILLHPSATRCIPHYCISVLVVSTVSASVCITPSPYLAFLNVVSIFGFWSFNILLLLLPSVNRLL